MAPSSRLVVYIATVFFTFSLVTVSAVAGVLGIIIVVACLLPADRRRDLVDSYGRRVSLFVITLFVLRVLLEWAGRRHGVDAPLFARDGLLYPSVRDTLRVAVLIAGAAIVAKATPPRAIVAELEQTSLPRAVRLVVMMVVQYPHVMARRYAQILEAQIARGAEPPRSMREKATYGMSLLLPLLQAELNALGDRASLIHTRRLDVETHRNSTWLGSRSAVDGATWAVSVAVLVAAVSFRIHRP